MYPVWSQHSCSSKEPQLRIPTYQKKKKSSKSTQMSSSKSSALGSQGNGSSTRLSSPGPDREMSSSLSSSTSGLSGGSSSTRLSSPFEDQTVGTGIKLKTVPEFTIDDRITNLNKFEVGLLTPPQVKEFNEVFTGRDIIW